MNEGKKFSLISQQNLASLAIWFFFSWVNNKINGNLPSLIRIASRGRHEYGVFLKGSQERLLHVGMKQKSRLYWRPEGERDTRRSGLSANESCYYVWNQSQRQKCLAVKKLKGAQDLKSSLISDMELHNLELFFWVLFLIWSSISSLYFISSILEW